MKSYYERDALNYSTLSKLDSNNPGAVFREEREEFKPSPAMTKGSLVDCLLFTPEEYDNQFLIKEEVTISPSIKEIIDKLADTDLIYNDTNLLSIARENNFGGKNWSDETILNRVKTDDSERYFKQKKLDTDKLIISQEIYNQAVNVTKVLKNHEFTSYIFCPIKGVEVVFQAPIYWSEIVRGSTIACKALLDIIILDHNNKLIIPIDLKVKSDSKYAFPSSFLRYKYYLQAAWYTKALKNTNHYLNKGYTVVNFSFLVTSFDYPDPPLIYKCSDQLMRVGEYGGDYENVTLRGVNELAEDYVWYRQTGNIDYPRHIYTNKGVINI